VSARYYTLIASLPALEYFETAKRTPINRVRLEQRLTMLEPDDALELRRCERLLTWRAHALRDEAAEFTALYEQLRTHTRHPSVLAFVDFRLAMRSVISALRARRLGIPLAQLERPWGLGAVVAVIERRWDVPDFGLATALPWVPHLRDCIDRQDARELGRAVFEHEWRFLARVAEQHPFGFPEVLAYVLRREIVERWQIRDAGAALQRFNTLTREALDAHARLQFD
jgi:hypothetical protein